ncbi:MAG: tRNA (adenosine(37)-N6)-threonylcarbamoyltransferase complex ATPase subunit type 1 TsaE [Clostridia bacterium]|nr:tRNA (adenosine(37)-N6)-threonylcarbamoyltransferase complex ATPase subunit type 1 TsaE [Clostridia bacterium]
MEKILNSSSTEQTEHIGASLAQALISDATLPRFVALYGDLGVGKTAFTRGFTHFAIPAAKVKSPTFALVNEYVGEKVKICHFDMYRIEDEDDLYSIGFYDYLNGKNLCITEWSENIEHSLPDSYVRVEIIKNNTSDPDSREIRISVIK